VGVLFKKKVNRKILVLLSVFAFLFNSLFPFFQTLSAQSVDGYFDVICTLSGEQVVFVELENSNSQKHDDSDCFKCPVCRVLTNASTCFIATNFSADSSHYHDIFIVPRIQTVKLTGFVFTHYSSQAPPAQI